MIGVPFFLFRQTGRQTDRQTDTHTHTAQSMYIIAKELTKPFTLLLLLPDLLYFFSLIAVSLMGLLCWFSSKESTAMQEMQETHVPSLGQEDPLEEAMATHSSILAWRIPRTEEPGGL